MTGEGVGELVRSTRIESLLRGHKGRGRRVARPRPWPDTGAARGRALAWRMQRHPLSTAGLARGRALAWLMQRHRLSTAGLARAAGLAASTVTAWLNGGAAGSGVDLVMQGRPSNVGKLLRVVQQLEPEWSDADVWELFGVPADLRPVWRLPGGDQGPEIVRAERLSGAVTSGVPLDVTVRRARAGGMQLHRCRGDLVVTADGEQPPADSEGLGQVQGFAPAAN